MLQSSAAEALTYKGITMASLNQGGKGMSRQGASLDARQAGKTEGSLAKERLAQGAQLLCQRALTKGEIAYQSQQDAQGPMRHPLLNWLFLGRQIKSVFPHTHVIAH